ncbi:MAG: hypothetical protein IJ565_05625 [Bacilli bacterium]|nr:hypothetical protein [Bacilli bacterium]
MDNLKERQYNEAIKRFEEIIKKLHINSEVITKFKNDRRCFSNRTTLDNDIILPIINEYEDKHDALVYYSILSSTPYGNVLDMLYVSKYEDEWYLGDITEDKYIYVASYNITTGYMEHGLILLGNYYGILVRDIEGECANLND